MKKLTFREVQLQELELLLQFKEFCHKYSLRYYLCGGSLLGAVRHKGFIPWDDDIDVCMPRPDYEKMISIVRETQELPMIALELNTATYPFAKLLSKRVMIKRDVTGKDDSFLWMDIFPMDGIPSDRKAVESLYKQVRTRIKMLLLSKTRVGHGSSILKKLIKGAIIPLLNLYGSKRIANDLRRLALSTPYETSTYAGGVVWGLYGVGERMVKADFEVVEYKEFEGHQFPVFSCWHEYLSGLYNDYMQPPPKEKQICHNMEVYLLEDGEHNE